MSLLDPPDCISQVLAGILDAHHHAWFLCGIGDSTQGFLNARQALYQLSYLRPNRFSKGYVNES